MQNLWGKKVEVIISVFASTSWMSLLHSELVWLTLFLPLVVQNQLDYSKYSCSSFPLAFLFTLFTFSLHSQIRLSCYFDSKSIIDMDSIQVDLCIKLKKIYCVGSRTSRRYTGRATCDCPNCQEADRLGPAGIHLKKRNIHSCHIPGCGKF